MESLTNGRRREVMSSTLRCMAALELLAKDPYEYTLSQVAASLRVNLTTAHRVLTTLLEAGLVEQQAASKRFRVTGKMLWVGTAYLRHNPVFLASYAILEELARQVDLMTHLAVWERDAVLYIHTVGPPGTQNLFAQIGERIPAHCTALGKAMLAWRPEEDLRTVFAGPVPAYTDRTITTLPAMQKELERVRAAGYAVDNEEGIPGMRCLAAPVRDQSGVARAAISVSATVSEVPHASVGKFARPILDAALRVSVQLGYRPTLLNPIAGKVTSKARVHGLETAPARGARREMKR
jgi:DNA-binding IclR family transcriptional regulator